jgi:23S rRNA (cytosine1962-C5)-methyltransferase
VAAGRREGRPARTDKAVDLGMTPTVTVSARGARRLHDGHLWVYRAEVREASASAGDLVRVQDPRGRPLGTALYSDRSQIALRLLARGEGDAGPALWRHRLEQAIAYRASLRLDATAYRLVHGEADLLPSLVVDRYGDWLVVQALSQGTDRQLPGIVAHLVEMLQPRGILARNDPKVRLLEGLDRRVEVLHGEVPERVEVVESGVTYAADLRHGQKTGLFLDQRENREAAARYARGRLLDVFSYHGGFALALARQCDEVLGIEVSEEACAQARLNAHRNGLPNVTMRAVNAFDELRELDRAGERFDAVVLDPPAFAKNRAALPQALKGYKEINLRALKLLRHGGVLVTCTCSHHVDEATFGAVVLGAAIDAGAQVTLVEKRMQGRDHPVLLGVPETYYLKCLVLRRLA